MGIEQGRMRRNELAHLGEPRTVAPVLNKAFLLSRAKLCSLSQALAYRLIRERRAAPPRSQATACIERVRSHLKSIEGAENEERDVWRGVRHRDLRRSVMDFLWKGIHNVHWIGAFWLKVPRMEGRAMCHSCQSLESLDHILTSCKAVGRAETWNLTGALWTRATGQVWQTPSLEDVLAIGPRSATAFTDGPTPAPRARLWRILVSEGAHLIWKLRCERVIGREDTPGWQHQEDCVATRWMAAVNARVRQDAVGTRHCYGRLALRKSLVLDTWRGALSGSRSLKKDWTSSQGVLVGIDPGIVNMAGPGDPRVPHWPAGRA